jgi:hypothetical protein
MAFLREQRRDTGWIARGKRRFEAPEPLHGGVAGPVGGRFFHHNGGGVVHRGLPRSASGREREFD